VSLWAGQKVEIESVSVSEPSACPSSPPLSTTLQQESIAHSVWHASATPAAAPSARPHAGRRPVVQKTLICACLSC